MKVLFTLLLGTLGGCLVFLLKMPVPWLIGSLLAVVVCQRMSFLTPPNKAFFRWMRVALGVTIGSTVTSSFTGSSAVLGITALTSIGFVVAITLAGYFYFKRLPTFNSRDAFVSSLPGGLTFILSIADDLGVNFPKIALIQTTRVFILISCFAIFGYFVGSPELTSSTLVSAFDFTLQKDSWQIVLLIVGCGLFSNFARIAGGHIIFPTIITGLIYSQGWVTVPVPELVKTVAMICFGVQIGHKLIGGSFKEYKEQTKASFMFTIFTIVIAMMVALTVGYFNNVSYFLIFLALAPGSIPEICLIALALGYDVSFVAAIHICRYLFIMLIGWVGMNVIGTNHVITRKLNALMGSMSIK